MKFKLKFCLLIIFLSFILIVKLFFKRRCLIEKTCDKFVRYTCDNGNCGGYGDRLKGIISAYIWALLTNRKLEIDISHPCLIQRVLEPNAFDWSVENNSKHQLLRPITFTLNAIDRQDIRESMSQLNIIDYHSDADVIVIKNNLDWTIPFSKNIFLGRSSRCEKK